MQCFVLSSLFFVFGFFSFFIMVMATSAFVSPCSKLDELYRCVGERLLDCPPQYRLMYETAVSSGRFVCNDGKQGRGDSRRTISESLVRQQNLRPCGGEKRLGFLNNFKWVCLFASLIRKKEVDRTTSMNSKKKTLESSKQTKKDHFYNLYLAIFFLI